MELTAPLVLRQQRERLLRLPRGLQHRPAEDLHCHIIGHVLGQLLDRLHRRVRLAERLLSEGAHGLKLGLASLPLDLGEHIVGLAKGNAGAQLEDASRQGVFGRERRRVKVDHFLVLALVEVVVDVDELAFGRVGIHGVFVGMGWVGGL